MRVLPLQLSNTKGVEEREDPIPEGELQIGRAPLRRSKLVAGGDSTPQLKRVNQDPRLIDHRALLAHAVEVHRTSSTPTRALYGGRDDQKNFDAFTNEPGLEAVARKLPCKRSAAVGVSGAILDIASLGAAAAISVDSNPAIGDMMLILTGILLAVDKKAIRQRWGEERRANEVRDRIVENHALAIGELRALGLPEDLVERAPRILENMATEYRWLDSTPAMRAGVGGNPLQMFAAIDLAHKRILLRSAPADAVLPAGPEELARWMDDLQLETYRDPNRAKQVVIGVLRTIDRTGAMTSSPWSRCSAYATEPELEREIPVPKSPEEAAEIATHFEARFWTEARRRKWSDEVGGPFSPWTGLIKAPETRSPYTPPGNRAGR